MENHHVFGFHGHPFTAMPSTSVITSGRASFYPRPVLSYEAAFAARVRACRWRWFEQRNCPKNLGPNQWEGFSGSTPLLCRVQGFLGRASYFSSLFRDREEPLWLRRSKNPQKQQEKVLTNHPFTQDFHHPTFSALLSRSCPSHSPLPCTSR